jgi:hypothetical protein
MSLELAGYCPRSLVNPCLGRGLTTDMREYAGARGERRGEEVQASPRTELFKFPIPATGCQTAG